MEPDFSGWATKADLKCSDGRTITSNAFKHMDGKKVPLVWQHGHSDPENILGYAILQHRDGGCYAYCFFNDTPRGKHSKTMVEHGDITSLSIYANKLVERSKVVHHGQIIEVSLVLSGANPGAHIETVNVKHGDEILELEDEVVIHFDVPDDADEDEDDDEGDGVAHADGKTVQEVYDSLNSDQQDLVHFMIGAALAEQKAGDGMAQSGTGEGTTSTETPPAGDGTTPEGTLTHQEGTTVTRNVFENGTKPQGEASYTLTHSDLQTITAAAKRPGATLKSAIEDFALSHGINDIDTLFPDYKNVTDRPEWVKRQTEWVAGVLNGARKSPFSRIKTMSADLTFEDARAKGYIKGTLKKEQFFGVLKRTTGPTTIYKKQKLDRDDIIDITDFDVVAWMKSEMRFMLEEEIARAILFGDGRAADDEDKVKDPAGATDGLGIRSIYNDDDFYAPKFYVNLGDANSTYMELVESIIRARRYYKGTGNPTMYTTEAVIAEMLLLRDDNGRRYWRTVDELAAELRVDKIVAVEAMESVTELVAILVNLSDYNVGADKGGEVSLFDDFDIDYNQYKYLIETRISGALIKYRSAQVFLKTDASDTLVTPAAPTQSDDEVTIVNTANAVYKIFAFTGAVTYNASPVTVGQTVTASFPIVLPDGASVTVQATPASDAYYFVDNVNEEWTFTYEA